MRFTDRSPGADEPPRHGAETLRVWEGTVVGITGRDVFVELGPRMQGVIGLGEFDEPPEEGDAFEFTLLGQEEGLWVLARADDQPLVTWENIEEGAYVSARVTGKNHGGLELRIGPLHGFMPKSQTGLNREQEPGILVGRTLTCEVIQVEDERQRVVLSRRNVLRRQKASELQRLVGSLRPGQVVQGRVTRIEDYGAFVSFGRGLEGLIHVSDLSHERIEHPRDVVKKGQSLKVKVLSIKRGGKRIGLGLKQTQDNPWVDFARRFGGGGLVHGRIRHIASFGAFVEVVPGVEGLLHRSEMDIEVDRAVREKFKVDEELSVRVLSVEVERERLSLSQFHSGGGLIGRDEASGAQFFGALLEERERARQAQGEADAQGGPLSMSFGRLMQRAFVRGEGAGAGEAEPAHEASAAAESGRDEESRGPQPESSRESKESSESESERERREGREAS